MPTPPSERNLLFAVLALQNELAKAEEVLAAMHAWVLAKHRPLGELLAGLWLSFARPLQLWGQRMDVSIPRRMAP